MKYIGIDIGDGETSAAAYEQGSVIEPVILPICGTKSLISAVGIVDGAVVIGENAYTNQLAGNLSVRFKSRFTTQPSSYEDIVRFARGIRQELESNGSLQPEDHLAIGCPAGWNAACRARYRDLLVRAGLKDPRIISESRAAFLYAKYAKTVALDINVLNESALVVDIGSSTLDYAYIVDGRETGVGTFGDTALGGGILDAAILRRAVDASHSRDSIRSVFKESRSWYSYCEIEARRLKEEYFTRLGQGERPVVRKQLRIYYDEPVKLNLCLDEEEVRHLISDPLPELDGRTFRDSIADSLRYASQVTKDRPPRLMLLTGGASRMPFFRDLCRAAFPEAVTVCCPEPEFSIAKGLAYAGWVDDNLTAFRKAIETEITDQRVSEAANSELGSFMPEIVRILTDLVLDQAAIPVANQWKSGEISTLQEMNKQLTDRMEKVMASPMAQEALTPVISNWVEGLEDNMQAMVDPICDRYSVPRKQMKINLSTTCAGSVQVDAGKLIGLPMVGTIIGAVVSVITGFLCGGTGIALIASGPLGFLAGVMIGAVASLVGWRPVSGSLMKVKLPGALRHIGLEKRLRSDSVRREIQQKLQKNISAENSEFRAKAVESFSSSFRGYLYSIAQAAQIPIE